MPHFWLCHCTFYDNLPSLIRVEQFSTCILSSYRYQGKWLFTNLFGVHRERRTVLSHTREQYNWLSLLRTLRPNWEPHWFTEMERISLCNQVELHFEIFSENIHSQSIICLKRVKVSILVHWYSQRIVHFIKTFILKIFFKVVSYYNYKLSLISVLTAFCS